MTASVYAAHGETCFRFVVTHLHHDGTRRLTLSANGSGTWETAEAAETWRGHLLANNDRDRLRSVFGPQALDTFRVDRVECWAGHFDPCATVYPGE